MGEKEGTAPSRTKKTSLNAQKKAQATADARVRSSFVTTWRQHHRLPVPHLALPNESRRYHY